MLLQALLEQLIAIVSSTHVWTAAFATIFVSPSFSTRIYLSITAARAHLRTITTND